MQSSTSWTHQFASGSSIAACSWHPAQDNTPCPLCVNVTILFPGLIWQLIQNHPSGSGVNTGGANLSAAGSVDRLSKNLSGTRVGTWDGKSPLQAFYPEGNTCLSRGENIPFKRLVQVSGINSHRKRNVENPRNCSCCPAYHMPFIQPTFLLDTSSTFITHLCHSSSPKLFPKCNNMHGVSPHPAER